MEENKLNTYTSISPSVDKISKKNSITDLHDEISLLQDTVENITHKQDDAIPGIKILLNEQDKITKVNGRISAHPVHLKQILLVEDDTEDQQLFISALECIKFSAFCKAVFNGQEAIDHLKHTSNYGIIFLDLNMPVMTGIDCLKHLKESNQYKNIPVVIMTTSLSPSDLNDCMELGAASVFHKPGTYSELCKGLDIILKPGY